MTEADRAHRQKAWSLSGVDKMAAVLSEGLPEDPGVGRIAKVKVRTRDAHYRRDWQASKSLWIGTSTMPLESNPTASLWPTWTRTVYLSLSSTPEI